ncbi:Mrr N-terminal domain protein [Leptospira interrogans str. L1207]|nr:Mrr N-terminal domain protein [Leptospira interrogans str. L1207]
MRKESQALLRYGVAIVFKTTEQERRELLPSGKTRIFDNRVAWSITYLKMAGLIQHLRDRFIQLQMKEVNF